MLRGDIVEFCSVSGKSIAIRKDSVHRVCMHIEGSEAGKNPHTAVYATTGVIRVREDYQSVLQKLEWLA